MTDDELRQRLEKLETRQEALIQGVSGLADVMEAIRDSVGELLAWAQEPPSSDLSGTIAGMANAISGLNDAIIALGRDLPARIVAALPK